MGSFFFALSAAAHDPSNNAAAKRRKACTKVTVFTARLKDIACIAHKFLEILERRSQADTSARSMGCWGCRMGRRPFGDCGTGTEDHGSGGASTESKTDYKDEFEYDWGTRRK